MADIHQVISLGLGAPADIPHFLLFGLSPNADVVEAVPEYVIVASADVDVIVATPDYEVIA